VQQQDAAVSKKFIWETIQTPFSSVKENLMLRRLFYSLAATIPSSTHSEIGPWAERLGRGVTGQAAQQFFIDDQRRGRPKLDPTQREGSGASSQVVANQRHSVWIQIFLFILTPPALDTVQGQIWASNDQIEVAFEALKKVKAGGDKPTGTVDQLTPREREVVSHVVEGLRNLEIASKLGVSEHTIRNYILRIYEKLGVSNRVQLTLKCAHQFGTATLSAAPPLKLGQSA
jgi:DNA-binding CsgD family transcriptional regulator